MENSFRNGHNSMRAEWVTIQVHVHLVSKGAVDWGSAKNSISGHKLEKPRCRSCNCCSRWRPGSRATRSISNCQAEQVFVLLPCSAPGSPWRLQCFAWLLHANFFPKKPMQQRIRKCGNSQTWNDNNNTQELQVLPLNLSQTFAMR